MYTHKQHRQRLRDRFRQEGLDNFSEVHALELLLFYAIPQIDTKPVARELLNRFGSFSQVLEATEEELQAVKGVGPGVATYLTLLNATCRYQRVNSQKESPILADSNACGKYLVEYFVGRRNETVVLLFLDAKCKLRNVRVFPECDVNSAELPIRKVVEYALAANATSVVIAHNHPSGVAIPSHEDVAITQQIGTALDAIGIVLADHIVVADNDFVSMAQSGYLRR